LRQRSQRRKQAKGEKQARGDQTLSHQHWLLCSFLIFTFYFSLFTFFQYPPTPA
jgi:hypothetical protein